MEGMDHASGINAAMLKAVESRVKVAIGGQIASVMSMLQDVHDKVRCRYVPSPDRQ